MTDEHIDEVLALYSDRKTVEKESYLASFEDIEKMILILIFLVMLIISKKKKMWIINALLQDMKKTDDELERVKSDFVSLLKELTSPHPDIISSLNDLIGKLEG
ncbi:MAG: hypothetical protein ACLTS6_03870 [Anaerobutyricum sp.]